MFSRAVRARRIVREILVVDGGSRDATGASSRAAMPRRRARPVVEAPPLPAGWNGKAWNLETGVRAVHAGEPSS